MKQYWLFELDLLGDIAELESMKDSTRIDAWTAQFHDEVPGARGA